MKLLLFFALTILSVQGAAQTLKNIFLILPTTAVAGLSVDLRKQMIENQQAGNNKKIGDHYYYFNSYQPSKGYLSFAGSYEGSTDITYWNTTKGYQIVSVSTFSCGGLCDCDIKFFKYEGKNLVELKKSDVLPDIKMSDFFAENVTIEEASSIALIEEDFQEHGLLFHLPKQGKNIIVETEYEDDEGAVLKFFKAHQIELIWNDGTFVKGKIIE